MIWFIISFFFLFSLKYFTFLSGLLLFNSLNINIRILVPLIFFLIYYRLHNFLDVKSLNFFTFTFLFISAFVCLTFVCLDPLIFLVFFEICVFPMSYALFILSKDWDKIDSAFFMLFINLLGSIPFIFFLSSYYIRLNFELRIIFNSFLDLLVMFNFSLLLFIKFPIFLGHVWLTKAHVRGSGSCSMILASIILKLGTFGFCKYVFFFQKNVRFVFIFLSSFCIFRSVFFLLNMFRVMDSKLFIASSSIVHISSIIPCVLFNSTVGLVGRIFIIVAHGFISYFLFLIVTIVYESINSRSINFNKNLESLNKVFTMFLFFLMFINLGLPPFLRFLRELFFCYLYFYTSSILFLFFCCSMIFSILYIIFFVYNFIFGKKNNSVIFCFDNKTISFVSFSFFFYFFFPMFFFLLSLSLKHLFVVKKI